MLMLDSCPTIFPPPTGKSRSGLEGRSSLEGRSGLGRSLRRMHDGIQLFSDDEPEITTSGALARMEKEQETQEEEKSDVTFIVLIIVFVVVTAIAVAVFCVMRYNRRKKNMSGTKYRDYFYHLHLSNFINTTLVNKCNLNISYIF